MTQAANAPGWPIVRGVQTLKEIVVLTMRQEAAAAALSKLWADTFLTNAGIDSINSTTYTYRGAANYDVIVDASTPAAHQAMTSNVLPVPLVASSDTAQGAQLAWMIFDYETATNYWQASGAYPHWAKLDLGSAKTITTYKVTTYDGTNYPTHWTLQGSATGAFAGEETTLDTVTTGQDSTDREYTVDTPGSYRYYRLLFTAGTNQEVLWKCCKFYLAAGTTTSIRSVQCLNLASAVTSLMPFFTVTLGTGSAAYYVSTNDGATWTAITSAQVGTLVGGLPSGTQIRLRCDLTGNAELEDWGVAA